MPPFHYAEPQSVPEAVALLAQPGAVAMGGGTDLLPQVKDGVVPAERLVGLAAIPGHGSGRRQAKLLAGNPTITWPDCAIKPDKG